LFLFMVKSISSNPDETRSFNIYKTPCQTSKMEKKSKELIQNENLSQIGGKALINLSRLYKTIEFPLAILGDETVHLYPTKSVKKLYINYQSSNILSFQEFLTLSGAEQKLSISKDTTYYPPKELLKTKIVTAESGALWRNNQELSPKTYMFVFDQDNTFLVNKKVRTGKQGRMHHSSLARGQAVLTAGNVTVSQPSKDLIHYTFTNESGHYKPDMKTLDIVLDWFKQNNLSFKK